MQNLGEKMLLKTKFYEHKALRFCNSKTFQNTSANSFAKILYARRLLFVQLLAGERARGANFGVEMLRERRRAACN